MIQDNFKFLTGLTAATRALCMPWLMLIARAWFAQILSVHQIMAMAESAHPSVLHVPSSVDVAFHMIVPLLLFAGFLSRPIALMLISQTLGGSSMISGAIGVKLALLMWLIVSGPDVFSLDHLLKRGMSVFPSRLMRAGDRFYDVLKRKGTPLALLAIRVALALAIVRQSSPVVQHAGLMMLGVPAGTLVQPAWLAVTVALLLVLGACTRLSALILALEISTAAVAMSMDDRLAVLLLVLLIAVAGGGLFSVDRLISLALSSVARRKSEPERRLPHVVVVGGGFGGVETVRGLSGLPCRITLIDQRNHHLFQPLLYQVATAALSPADIATPIRELFRAQRNVRVQLAQVTGVDTAKREVLTASRSVSFDYLVLATGARHGYFGKDAWAQFAPGLKTIDDAVSIRSRLLRAFEEAENAVDDTVRNAWMTFVIVGGGPTGIELAGAIRELAHHGMSDEYRVIDPSTARVILLQSADRILPAFSAASSAAAQRSLSSLGVEVRLRSKVLSVDTDGVGIHGEHIPARTVLWAAGVEASAAAQWLGQEADSSGRLAVSADLSVAGLDGVFALGDTALSLGWNGATVPGLASAAKQQGRYAARVIGLRLRGRPAPPPFQYRHSGSLATIGRQAAVADFGRVRLWGAPAWWFWGAAHIVFLAGSRNRLTVLLNWLWAYLTYKRTTRLISDE
ncbi:NADH dehydrogenase [Caballeronia sordidicola]|uniref:NADH:ubiquinone reductase (non-electrogenic) n=2 Tax=Caballeronia sordidicola TaxID=196367 RepID=A0A242MG67_CABSO|nr:NADH dehydrogenase [Caballeronia sordidicola]